MNIEGMLPFENRVHDYVENTGNHVLYRSTPIFEGSNLVANGVLLEGLSVEDNGNGVLFCVYCYNIQPGIEIDYATGDSHVEFIQQIHSKHKHKKVSLSHLQFRTGYEK